MPEPGAPIPTEAFSAWLRGFTAAQRDRAGGGAAVPCGECRGCCTSGYFIPIAPDEADTLAHIPKALLFPAPGLPKGHMLLGYRENGHCPLFRENRCTIYPHRPRTCRRYDCRLFAAAGAAVEEGKPAIAAQAARWRFAYPEARDHREQAAVRAAARFLDNHAGRFPAGFLPPHPAGRALVAVAAHAAFLEEAAAAEGAALPPVAAPPEGRAGAADEAAIRSRVAAVVEACGGRAAPRKAGR